MAVFRIEKTRDYTVMSNHHLKDRTLTLKSKGLLSMMLSLPDEWNYTTRGLAAICREGVDSIGAALKELETHGYIRRTQLRDEKGKITDTEYVIYEMPQGEPPSSPGTPLPGTAKPYTENPDTLPLQIRINHQNNGCIIVQVTNNRRHGFLTRKLRCPVPPVTRNDFITTVGVRTDNRRSENSEISDALCRFHHFFIINHTEGVSLKGV